jgi:Flp pilus assembly protein TadG
VRTKRDEAGAATVEFALIVVLLVSLAFGIIQFGLGLYQAQGASNGIREAARRAAVGDIRTCSGGSSSTDLTGIVNSSMAGVQHGVPSMSYSPAPSNTSGTAQAGDTVTVTVPYDISLNIVSGLIPGIPPSISRTAAAQSRVENFVTGAGGSKSQCP